MQTQPRKKLELIQALEKKLRALLAEWKQQHAAPAVRFTDATGSGSVGGGGGSGAGSGAVAGPPAAESTN